MLVAPQAVPAVHGGLQEHQGTQGERPGTKGYLAASPIAPSPVRFPGGADAELNRMLADHDRGARHDATRERSREYRDQADAGEHRGRGQAFQERLVPDLAERGLDLVQRHTIHTPGSSRHSASRRSSPRASPVTPYTRDDRVSDLQGQVYELQRRLRQIEVHAHQ